MTKQLSWSQKNGVLQLFGKINQNTLSWLWDSRLKVMQGVTAIDLSAIVHIDTAGIALLIHLVELAKKQRIKIVVTGVSKNIVTLSKLYNLPDDVLPVNFEFQKF